MQNETTTHEKVKEAIDHIKAAREHLEAARFLAVDVGAPTLDVLKVQVRMMKLDKKLTALKKHFGSKIGAVR